MEAVNVWTQDNVTGRLARLFPEAMAMRIPVRMERGSGTTELTTIEFGTTTEVIFRAVADLDFGESVRLRNRDGSLDMQVRVIATHWIDSEYAVAARFTSPVANWIIKA